MVIEIILIVFIVVWCVGILYYLAFKHGYARGEYDTYKSLGYCNKDGSIDTDKVNKVLFPQPVDTTEEDDGK